VNIPLHAGAQVKAGSTPVGAFYPGIEKRGGQRWLRGKLGVGQVRVRIGGQAGQHHRAVAGAMVVVMFRLCGLVIAGRRMMVVVMSKRRLHMHVRVFVRFLEHMEKLPLSQQALQR